MNSMQLVALLDACLRTGKTAVEIAERLCLRNDGKPLPSLEEFEKETEQLRGLKPLSGEIEDRHACRLPDA